MVEAGANLLPPPKSPMRRPAPAPGVNEDSSCLPPSGKRLRAVPSLMEGQLSLRSLLSKALPDKEAFIDGWVNALAAPAVCITDVQDVQRLDPEDIASLPVPPLVKGVFRDILNCEADKHREHTLELTSTLARSQQFLAPLRDRNMQPPLAGSKYFQDQKNYKLILKKEEIKAGVRIVARRIETWCKGERIVLVAILKGAFMFLSDLCRALVRPYSVYFVEASSYKDKRAQSGTVDIASDLSASKFCDAVTKAPHKVVLVDELLDNGKTMQEMKQHFLSKLSSTHTEDDVLTVCLLSKERQREWPEADIIGIPNLPDLWLVGYGLDDRGTKRGWTELFAIPKVKIVDTFDVEEVQNLMKNMDEQGHLEKTIIFAGFELSCSSKQKYRVQGLDFHQGVISLKGAKTSQAKFLTKAETQRLVDSVPTVKGKFEHELQFSFIQENVHLVPEDDIFSGNNQVWAEMRCRLRRHIDTSAERFGVLGVEQAKKR
eukprot:TRINITY_DN93516_c0_g1_i1.p1 TRINITY_DN93516_c0_g1~~TRINITY_DN93516_c0_g1_i1.p1  ORF type:complete len:488 (-),score=112.29 TRINITY_DN93516_c0_g1_i1:202-1665(-)